MPNPTVTQVHFDQPLTNISVAYLQSPSAFIASRVFPIVDVAKKSDTYWSYATADFARDDLKERADGAVSEGGGFRVDPNNVYFCRTFARHMKITDEMRANADTPLQLDRSVTEYLTQLAMIRRESAFVTAYMRTGVWGIDQTGVAAAPAANQFLQWNDAASDPIINIRRAMAQVQLRSRNRPNKLVLPREVFDVLVDHPDIIARLDSGQTPNGPAVANEVALAKIFGVSEVLVMDAVVNTADAGLAETNAWIAPKGALLVYAAPSPGLMVPSGGYTFTWRGAGGSLTSGVGIRTWRDGPAEADAIEIQTNFDMRLVGAPCGAYFHNVIA